MAGILLSNDNFLFITAAWRACLVQHRDTDNDWRMLTAVFTADITLPLHQCVQFHRAGRWDKHPQCPQTVSWPPTSDVLDVKCHRAPELFPGQGGGLGERVGVWRWGGMTIAQTVTESLECKNKIRRKWFIFFKTFRKAPGDPVLTADMDTCSEALAQLDDVIMHTFQQCVYHLTKVPWWTLCSLLLNERVNTLNLWFD